MPFLNKSEATKRSRDRKENGKCTNATNCRIRVGLSTSFCTDQERCEQKSNLATPPASAFVVVPRDQFSIYIRNTKLKIEINFQFLILVNEFSIFDLKQT